MEITLIGEMRRLSCAATRIVNCRQDDEFISKFYGKEAADKCRPLGKAFAKIEAAMVEAYAEFSKLPEFENTLKETLADPYGDASRDPEDLESDYANEIRRCTKEFVDRAAALNAA